MTRRPLALAVVALAVVAMLAMTTGATAGSSRDRATGGGQILVGTRGAGDTIAFTAQQLAEGDDTAAKGEVQYINRTGGTGKGGIREHGDVFCIVVMGDMAEIGYHPKGDPDGDIDQLYVVDGGEPNQGNDIVFIDETPQSVCDFEEDDDDGEVALARGNVQVYDASA